MATYKLYFPQGSIHGTYDLTPQEGSLNFLSADYLGTLRVSCSDKLELKAKAPKA